MAFASVGQLEADETIRPGSTVEALAGLRSAFADAERTDRFGEIDGKVTTGISSLVNDGSAALLVTTSEIATARGWRPRARVHPMSVVGDDPVYLLTAIIPATATATATATAKVLGRAGLSIDVIDAFEVNEAFASEVLCWLADTAADRIAQTAAAMLLEVKLEPIFHRDSTSFLTGPV